MNRPVMKDKTAWHYMLMEHRYALLERVVAEFPDVINTQRAKVDMWRLRLQRL